MIWFIAEIRQDGSRVYHDPGEESRENAETIRDYLQRCNRSKTFIITNVRDWDYWSSNRTNTTHTNQ